MSRDRTRPTLKSVAAETGLAVTTVSRALNDAPDIGVGTKLRVREAAQRIGYTPNRAGVRLRTGRSNVISILMAPERDLTGHTARLIHAFASTLRETPFHLIVTPVFDDEDPLKQLRYLRDTSSADAVVMNRIQPQDERIAFLARHNIPFVTHGRSAMSIQHAWYDFDNVRFARIAVEALAARGRRSVLIVAPPIDQHYAQHIMEGAGEAAALRDVAIERLTTATSDSPAPELEEAVVARVASGGIDAVICASVAATVTAVGAVERVGHVVGQSIDVAAKEPFPFLKRFRDPILAISENAEAAGAFLARAALRRIQHPDSEPMQHLEVPQWPALDS